MTNEREELAIWFESLPIPADNSAYSSVPSGMDIRIDRNRRDMIVAALRTPAVTDEMVEEGRKEAQYYWPISSSMMRVILTAAFAAKSSPAPPASSLPSGESEPSVMSAYGAGDPDIFDTTTNAGLADLIERSHLISVRHKSNGIDRAFAPEIKARIVVALRCGESVIGN